MLQNSEKLTDFVLGMDNRRGEKDVITQCPPRVKLFLAPLDNYHVSKL